MTGEEKMINHSKNPNKNAKRWGFFLTHTLFYDTLARSKKCVFQKERRAIKRFDRRITSPPCYTFCRTTWVHG